nr:MAG TPA: hypothetical protein [Caudoviricetes sp.]
MNLKLRSSFRLYDHMTEQQDKNIVSNIDVGKIIVYYIIGF